MFNNSGSLPISSKVLSYNALTILNEQLPHSFIHISSLRLLFCGAFKPPAINKSAIILSLSDFDPSGSPNVNLSPPLCLITPGSVISAAG